MANHKPLVFFQTLTTALDEAQAFVTTNLDRGVECPCCRQRAQRYRRSITSSMGAALIYVYNYFATEERRARSLQKNDPNAKPPEWLHVPSYLSRVYGGVGVRGGDWAKLRYWDFLEPKDDEIRSDGSNRNGLWKITPAGKLFATNASKAAKYVYLYDGQVQGFEGPQIGIRDALKTKFNYESLMDFGEGPTPQ